MHLSRVILRAANNNPQGGGTAFAGRRQTWSEFVDRVSRIAEGLRHAGVRSGDRVAVISQNSDRYCELMFAINWAGGVVQLVSMRLAPAEMVDQIEDSGALCVITDEAGAQAIAPLRSSLAERQWIGIGETPGEGTG